MATFTSISSGNWDSASTWDGPHGGRDYPGEGLSDGTDRAVINHTVTNNGNHHIGSITINASKELNGGGGNILYIHGDSNATSLENNGSVTNTPRIEFRNTGADKNAKFGTGTYGLVEVNCSGRTVTMTSAMTTSNNLTISAGTLDTGSTGRAITVTGDVTVTGTLDLDAASSDANYSFGSLKINSGGTVQAPSHGTITITSEASSGYAIEVSGTYTHNSGTLKITTDANSLVKILDDVNHLIIEAATATRVYEWVNNTTIQGNLTINAGRFAHYSPNFSLDVQGDCTINNTGTLTGGSGSIELGSLTIASGGTYSATSGTTTITSNTATGTRSVYNNGGTFTHNNGTLKIDTSANTNYDFDGDDLYNFTVECEDGSGAVTCDGEALTPVTVLNNLDIKMGILRTNINSFTIHGNVFVRETSLTNKNKFVAQGANQTVKGIITVEDGAFFDMQNQGSGSFGTLTTGGIRVL